MSKANPLAGLLANYGDSDEESDDGSRAPPLPPGPVPRTTFTAPMPGQNYANASGTANASAAVHPAPIPHCPWSACYDETSGFTYYWNQQTNAVTWEAPPEYLLALKLAQQQLHLSGTAEVSAEEWQLYQQALAEKQNTQNNKIITKSSIKTIKMTERNSTGIKEKHSKSSKKRGHSDDEEETIEEVEHDLWEMFGDEMDIGDLSYIDRSRNSESSNSTVPASESDSDSEFSARKIELITSYHNSDSESNDEAETPTKVAAPPLPKSAKPSLPSKKAKIKPVEYGPALPPKQNYTMPIGPELPPELMNNGSNSPVNKAENDSGKEDKKSDKTNDEDSQDESLLFLKLKNKAKLLEKLGGELPKDLQKIIEEEPRSGSITPKGDDVSIKSNNIDDLLEEIEKKELPKISKAKKLDIFDEKSNDVLSAKSSPRGDATPPIEAKPLFPSIRNIDEAPFIPPSVPLTPPVVMEVENEEKKAEVTEKKGVNLYLMDTEERRENIFKKKLRLSNSVLPDRKKTEEPAYTTKYSQFIEGFSNERTGLGFSKEDDEHESPKNTINYGNGLMFTKGETLNEDKKDEDLDDLTDLVEAKLKYLNQLQPCVLTPVQEMLIQMQTLVSAFRAGAVSVVYWRRWAEAAAESLAAHEAGAAPPGWTAAFLRSEGRYCYRREADGLVQWEYPATTHTDMEICTTPPHPGIDAKDEPAPPLASPPPPTSVPSPAAAGASTWGRALSPPAPPPPPAWTDPPPPGCDDLPPLPANSEQKQEIGDELASFYSDIAELEKQTSGPHTASNSPEPVDIKEKHKERDKEKDKDAKVSKKKSKVKISASMGLKHKTVSSLVAKWQQVADEINSD